MDVFAPKNIFTALAAGQAPQNAGILRDEKAFSAPLKHEDFLRPIKRAGTPVILPRQLAQFDEFTRTAARDFKAAHGAEAFAASGVLLTVKQKILAPGEYSFFGGVHLDTYLAKAVRDNAEGIKNYAASDVGELTTQFFTDPLDMPADRYRHMSSDVLPPFFNAELARKCEGSTCFLPEPYQVTGFTDTVPHAARTPIDTPVRRTFAFLTFTLDRNPDQISDHMANSNPALHRWWLQNRLER